MKGYRKRRKTREKKIKETDEDTKYNDLKKLPILPEEGPPENPTAEEKEEIKIVSEFNRSMSMCAYYKKEIMQCKDKFDINFKRDLDLLTEKQKSDRQMELVAQSQTMKSLVEQYQKHNDKITTTCDNNDVEFYIKNLSDVLNVSNHLKPLLEQKDNKMKKKLALQKSAQLEAMVLQKFNGAGDNRCLNFKQFDDDFQKLVMRKEYT